jgi:uncharacterized protein YjlB
VKKTVIRRYTIKETEKFPNSRLPLLIYKSVLPVKGIFPGSTVRNLFEENGWSNSWRSGIYTYHHYHSVTHEVLGVIKGKAVLQFGGPGGKRISVNTGDVIIIPAGVGHKNLGKENDLKCIGAYPNGKDYDMNYGEEGERPRTDKNIKKVRLPKKDPVFGNDGILMKYWKKR